MKKILLGILLAVLIISSCTRENLDFGIENPIDIELSSNWVEGALDDVQSEFWYRVAIGSEVNQVYIEWSELDYHGNSRDYTADVMIDAFWLDGETEYFIDKNNGYGEDARLISTSSSAGLLIRVRMNNDIPGTFALKVYEKETGGELELININVGTEWSDYSIADGETIGFLVSGGMTDQEIKIQWSEFDSPETGFTADIKGSVFMLDQTTEYKIVDNGKSFIGKDSSHSDNPKAIRLDKEETEFIVIITLNDPTKPGNFSIQMK